MAHACNTNTRGWRIQFSHPWLHGKFRSCLAYLDAISRKPEILTTNWLNKLLPFIWKLKFFGSCAGWFFFQLDTDDNHVERGDLKQENGSSVGHFVDWWEGQTHCGGTSHGWWAWAVQERLLWEQAEEQCYSMDAPGSCLLECLPWLLSERNCGYDMWAKYTLLSSGWFLSQKAH